MTPERELFLLHQALNEHGIRAVVRKEAGRGVVGLVLIRAPADPSDPGVVSNFDRLGGTGAGTLLRKQSECAPEFRGVP